jgi:hypothetical protein
MSITSTAPGRSNGNGHHANTNGHGLNGTSTNGNGANGHRAANPAGAPTSRPPAQPGVIQLLREADAAERQQESPLQARCGAGSAGGFSAEQIAALSAPLDRARICSREQGRGRVNYLQGWVLIEEANRIFGFDGWQRQTLSSRCVTEAKRLIGSKNEGRPQKEGWGVTYIARVRITVYAGAQGLLIREGTGAGHGIDVDLGLAHESAIKEAETDAMKRALVTFGNPFGLPLYDRSQRQVSGAPAPAQAQAQARASNGPRPAPANGVVRRPQATAPNPVAAAFNGPPRPTSTAAPTPATQRLATQREPAQPAAAQPLAAQPQAAQPQAAPAPDSPLDPPTIRSLQEHIRGLLPPQLAAFSRAFRSAFQVPESTPSIAGLITQQRHRLWIQRYLAQGLGQGQPQARTA